MRLKLHTLAYFKRTIHNELGPRKLRIIIETLILTSNILSQINKTSYLQERRLKQFNKLYQKRVIDHTNHNLDRKLQIKITKLDDREAVKYYKTLLFDAKETIHKLTREVVVKKSKKDKDDDDDDE